MKIGRNDLCWCGNGKKYKKCHLGKEGDKIGQELFLERKVYSDQWEKSAEHFSSNKYYEWIASKLESYLPSSIARIFDVGCGNGSGLLALFDAFKESTLSVISIDENIECLKTSKKNLEEDGLNVNLIDRINITLTDNEYFLTHNNIEDLSIVKGGVTLIESDILSDTNLYNFSIKHNDFDAVTIWLIGTHGGWSNCAHIKQYNMQTSGEYRLHVQNRVYELADKILKIGGILQVVDRGEVLSSELLRQDCLNSHREQASLTNLEVVDLDEIIYTEPEGKTGIQTVGTPGISGRIPNFNQISMRSVISVKRK